MIIIDNKNVVISSRVRLARNYCDIPFCNLNNDNNAIICMDRACKALYNKDQFELIKLSAIKNLMQQSLVEQHLISQDLVKNSNIGAVLISKDKHLSIMINEEDHLRIQAMLNGLQLEQALKLALEAEEKLEKICDFSFDTQLGYLTACPTNTGTGMRASIMMHLPLVTKNKQMGRVSQLVAKLGLTIRGIYGEGSEALGDLYQVSNQVTLGRTEKEIIEAVTAVGTQLIEMEIALRKSSINNKQSLEDAIWRSYGILKYAKIMTSSEFMQHWSNIRLGATMNILPVSLDKIDELLTTAQDAHADLHNNNKKDILSTNQARCDIIHEIISCKEE